MSKLAVGPLQIQMSAHCSADLLAECLVFKNSVGLPQPLLGDRADLVRHDNRVLRLTSFAGLQQNFGGVDASSRLSCGQREHRDDGQRFIDSLMRDYQNWALASLFSSYDWVQISSKEMPLK
jgi:hypothetical protein